jgi:hypothetical protein
VPESDDYDRFFDIKEEREDEEEYFDAVEPNDQHHVQNHIEDILPSIRKPKIKTRRDIVNNDPAKDPQPTYWTRMKQLHALLRSSDKAKEICKNVNGKFRSSSRFMYDGILFSMRFAEEEANFRIREELSFTPQRGSVLLKVDEVRDLCKMAGHLSGAESLSWKRAKSVFRLLGARIVNRDGFREMVYLPKPPPETSDMKLKFLVRTFHRPHEEELGRQLAYAVAEFLKKDIEFDFGKLKEVSYQEMNKD